MSTDLSTKLTEAERRKFNDLDGIIRKGLQTFAEVGASLAIIREQRLYREEYDTFEAYCQDRCGWGRDRAYQLIEAHAVVASLPTNVGIEPPANEAQARALVDVPPEQRATVLEEARADAEASGKKVSAERIRETAHRYTPLRDRKPRKPRSESPSDMAAALVKAAEKHTRTIPDVVMEDHTSTSKAPAAVGGAGSTPAAGVQPEPATEADGGVDTPPVSKGTEASSAEAASPPRASSAEGAVVVFVSRILPTVLPDPQSVGGMSAEDAERIAGLRAWCGVVLAEYRRLA